MDVAARRERLDRLRPLVNHLKGLSLVCGVRLMCVLENHHTKRESQSRNLEREEAEGRSRGARVSRNVAEVEARVDDRAPHGTEHLLRAHLAAGPRARRKRRRPRADLVRERNSSKRERIEF